MDTIYGIKYTGEDGTEELACDSRTVVAGPGGFSTSEVPFQLTGLTMARELAESFNERFADEGFPGTFEACRIEFMPKPLGEK